jgi:hypothetical protein
MLGQPDKVALTEQDLNEWVTQRGTGQRSQTDAPTSCKQTGTHEESWMLY